MITHQLILDLIHKAIKIMLINTNGKIQNLIQPMIILKDSHIQVDLKEIKSEKIIYTHFLHLISKI